MSAKFVQRMSTSKIQKPLCFAHAFLFFLSTMWIIGGCNSHGPKNENKLVFTMNIFSGITTLDPAFAKDQSAIWTTHQIFNGLVKLDHHLQPMPDLARSWEISADLKTYTFHLKQGVYFHNSPQLNFKSRAFNAHDFLFSFQRVMDPEVASSGAWIFNDKVDSLLPFEAPNDSTFIIRLRKPFAPFLGLLSMPYASVVAKETVNHDQFSTHPVGTGPFQVFEHGPGEALILHKNPRYHETDSQGVQLPYLDAVKITFIPDRSSEFISFLAGNLDFINGLDAAYKDKLLDKNGNLQPALREKINYLKSPYLNTEYLGFSMSEKCPLAYRNPLVRKAMACGFDRGNMLKYLRNNIGIPGTGSMIPPGLPGFDSSLMEANRFQPQLAEKLLQEAGYPNGKNLPKIKLWTNPTYLDLCLFLQDSWKKLGIPVEVESMPPAQLRKAIKSGEAAFFRASWIADYPHCENYFQLFFSKNFSPQGPNTTHFSNPLYDQFFQEYSQLSQQLESEKMASKLQKFIIQESPVIVLYYDQVVRFSQKKWEGLEPNAINLLELSHVRPASH